MIILAPEIGVAIAMDQYLLARESQEGRDVNKKEDVNEGGKVKEDSEIGGMSEGKLVEEGPRQSEEEEISVEKREADAIYQILQKENFPLGTRFSYSLRRGKSEITKTHAFLANMGGFRIKILFPGRQRKDDVRTHPIELYLRDWRGLGQY